jgi:hypothetical protein
MRQFLICILLSLILAGCSFPKRTSIPTLPVEDAVATTLAMLPATNTPKPIPTILPTATPFDLTGLFCEYQFCVGHPIDMAFYDVSAQQNAGSPSTYSQGILASYNANLFLQVMWQIAPGASDPQFLLDLIIDAGLDTRVGNLEVKLVRDMNVVYTPLTSIATPVLPFGGAAAWTCGDRVFAWKAYTPDDTSTPGLFEEALRRFNCNR